MSSVKSLANKVTLLERKVSFGDYGGIRVGGGLLEVDVSNSKVLINSSRVNIGTGSGSQSQGERAIAIGQFSGVVNQGTNAIAIGAYAGVVNQNQESIVIDASGSASDSIGANQRGLFIRPIRPVGVATSANGLAYDPVSKEITHVSTKTFVIDHPNHQDKYLVHACLEGPEAGVYYRGKGEITNGEETIIYLPEYTKYFTDFTIDITSIGKYNKTIYSVSEVEQIEETGNLKFSVYGSNGSFFWKVFGKRQEIEVEPSKSDVIVKGDGPYTYISN